MFDKFFLCFVFAPTNFAFSSCLFELALGIVIYDFSLIFDEFELNIIKLLFSLARAIPPGIN